MTHIVLKVLVTLAGTLERERRKKHQPLQMRSINPPEAGCCAVIWRGKESIFRELSARGKRSVNRCLKGRMATHQELLYDCRGEGWQAWLRLVEVG